MNKAAKTIILKKARYNRGTHQGSSTTVIKLSLEQIHENKAKVGGP